MPKFNQLIRTSFLAGLIIIQFLVIVNYINQNSTIDSQISSNKKNITQEQDRQKALRNNLQQDINEEIRRTFVQSARSGAMTRIEPNKVIQLPGGNTNNNQKASIPATNQQQNTRTLTN